jgi:hypothetical protein
MEEVKANKSFASRLVTWGLALCALLLGGWIADEMTATPTSWAACTVTRIDITEVVINGAVRRETTRVSSMDCGASGSTFLKKQIAFKDLNQLRGGSKVLCMEFKTAYLGSRTVSNCKIAS